FGIMLRSEATSNSSFVAVVVESVGDSTTQCRLVQRDAAGKFSSEVVAEVNEPLSGRLHISGDISSTAEQISITFSTDSEFFIADQKFPLRKLSKLNYSGVVVFK